MNANLASPDTNAIEAAVNWIGALVSGTLGSAVAVIAVASIGYLLMTARLDARRAAQVILGCFMIFGASTIAAGIVGAIRRESDAASMQPSPVASISPLAPATPVASRPYDPYAGAALPTRR